MASVWLGVDLGTTGTRCLAFDAELNVLASAYRENPPTHLSDGRVEQDPESWMSTTCDAIADVVDAVGASSVESLAISSQGITVVPVSRQGIALRPAISWLDLRGERMLPELARRIDPAEVGRRTGKPWSGAYTLPKAMWLACEEPEVLRTARWLLTPLDFLHLRLTGRAVTDHTMASGTMAYRLDNQTWDTELLSAAGLDADMFPEILWSGNEIGRLLPEVASRLGMARVPVFMGGQDQKCAALAAGIGPAVTTLSLGTSAALESLTTSVGDRSAVPVFSFLDPGTWVKEAPVETAGAAHRWFAGILSQTPDYDAFEELVSEAGPGVHRPLFMPHLSRLGVASDRARWGTEPAGVFWGLGLDTGRAELARAVLEGISFEVDRHLRLMDDGESDLRVFGGGARSAAWCQLLADTTGRRVEALACPEAAAAGAAMLAGAPGTLQPSESYAAGEDADAVRMSRDAWTRLRRELGILSRIEVS